jgi:glycosyltransferase involved in cell wall biosynthesis/peptidoglycan/xylan/chitin deacetylase (PgdA/CDA1 family)
VSLRLLDWESLRERAVAFAAPLLFECQLIRLRVDRALTTVFGTSGNRRVVATACWAFPIYSQTFVYQELTQLIRGGFTLRFLYSHLDWRDPLPSQFRPVWRSRRRLLLHPDVCERSYAHFARRAPKRIERLIAMLSDASGLPADAIRTHYHVRQGFAFARMVEAYRPAYLHSYFFYEGSLFALVASYLLDIPRGVSCYADHMLEDYPLKVVALHLRQSSVTIATSERIRKELLTIEPRMDPNRMLVKPNGINATAFPALNRDESAVPKRWSLVSVSRIEPKKGLMYLVDAVGLLRDRGVHVDLHLIGGVDDSLASREYHHALIERINARALGDIVHLDGRRTEAEINECFKTAHVFVAPFVETETGDKDGVPTAVLEAMAAGLPVIATDAGSLVEVIEDGHDGLIVPQRDAQAIAARIALLLADGGRRSTLGANAARKVRLKFDAATGERAFHNRLRSLLASDAVPAPAPPPVVTTPRTRPAARGAVLMYHRVAHLEFDETHLCIPQSDFEAHMKHLRTAYELMPLDAMVRAAADGTMPDRAVAVTFDDGYLDSLTAASPVLLEQRIPATFFVNTMELDRENEVWGDTLKRIFLAQSALPDSIDLEMAGTPVMMPTRSAPDRRAAWETVKEIFYPLSAEARRAALRTVMDWSGLDLPPRASHRRMVGHEVRSLADRPGHQIGAHTTHHLQLTDHPPEVQRQEMADNKVQLELLLGRPVSTIAYPYGIHDQTTVEIARAVGFMCAVTIEPGLVRTGTEALRLPRLAVSMADIQSFAALLKDAFEEA